ncbi:MAG: hypothetical protein CMI56_03000 [Parcubacteria group bacterium]|nr:hypothetical protein [Parcubacteria group bacterium]
MKSKHAQMNAAIMVFATKENVNATLVTQMLIAVYNTALKTVMDTDNVLITLVVYANLDLKVLVAKRNNAQ